MWLYLPPFHPATSLGRYPTGQKRSRTLGAAPAGLPHPDRMMLALRGAAPSSAWPLAPTSPAAPAGPAGLGSREGGVSRRKTSARAALVIDEAERAETLGEMLATTLAAL